VEIRTDDNDRRKRYRFHQGGLDDYEKQEGEFELQSNYISNKNIYHVENIFADRFFLRRY